jgi:hypothetical protein
MCTPWTKKDKIHMAPEHMLFKHVDSLHLPEDVYNELLEQRVFFSAGKMETMCNWSYGKFIDWYNSSL